MKRDSVNCVALPVPTVILLPLAASRLNYYRSIVAFIYRYGPHLD